MLVVLPVLGVAAPLPSFVGGQVVADGRAEFVGRRHVVGLAPGVDVGADHAEFCRQLLFVMVLDEAANLVEILRDGVGGVARLAAALDLRIPSLEFLASLESARSGI